MPFPRLFTPSAQQPLSCPCYELSDSNKDRGGFSDFSPEDYPMPSPVYDFDYRSKNLARNNVYLLDRYDPLPDACANLAERICRQPSTFQELTIQEIAIDTRFRHLRGPAYEQDVVDIFLDKFAPPSTSHVKVNQQSRQVSIKEKHVPIIAHAAKGVKLSKPIPDLVYGYSSRAFMHDGAEIDIATICNVNAHDDGLMLPFLTVEAKGQWPADSSNLCVAENEAAGSSSACVKIAEDLKAWLSLSANSRVASRLDTASFSIALNGSEARLLMTWREGCYVYKVKRLRSYCLGEAEQGIQFRGAVGNVLHWGYTERLNHISACLRMMIEESS